MKRHREEALKLELERLETLLSPLARAQGHPWMVTLVAKQDLWWNKRTEIKRHYEEGDYNSLIENARTTIGAGFKHVYRSASFVIQNFAFDDKKTLAPNCKGYDQVLQAINQLALVNDIRHLLEERSP